MSADEGNAVEEVVDELQRAMRMFPTFNSPHEGYAVILEELDELWDEVKDNPKTEPLRRLRVERMRQEATQVAAMAIRFMLECAE